MHEKRPFKGKGPIIRHCRIDGGGQIVLPPEVCSAIGHPEHIEIRVEDGQLTLSPIREVKPLTIEEQFLQANTTEAAERRKPGTTVELTKNRTLNGGSTKLYKGQTGRVVDTASNQVGGRIFVRFEGDHGEVFMTDIYEEYLKVVSLNAAKATSRSQ